MKNRSLPFLSNHTREHSHPKSGESALDRSSYVQTVLNQSIKTQNFYGTILSHQYPQRQ